MSTERRPFIGPGDRLPAVTLDEAGGRSVDVRRGRHDSLVLVFPHPHCEACRTFLGGLGDLARALSVWDGQPMAVVGDVDEARATTAPGSPHVLVDARGQARRDAGIPADGAAVLVGDRYGTVYRADAVGDDHGFPTVDELVTEARYIAVQCPECSVPDLAGGWGR